MKYKITIERREENKKFDEEYKEWKDNQQWGHNRNIEMPRSEHVHNALICELTEEEYKSLKANVMANFT